MEPTGPANFIIIILTAVISWLGFRDPRLIYQFSFRPERILAHKEYYRLVSMGFLHGDWQHLFFNMMSLYFFGRQIEAGLGVSEFLLIYFGSILGGSLLALWIHRQQDYSALGASGGVCGILYASIFLFPGGSIMIFPIPIGIPAWLYAVLFLVVSFYGLGARADNIAHDAHIGGAICGLLITTGLHPGIVESSPRLFAAVLGLSLFLLFYLAVNPLLLPPSAVWRTYLQKRRTNQWIRESRSERPTRPVNRQSDAARMDSLLEKISANGFNSLSEEEKDFLRRMSGGKGG